ncbi:C-type lectin domain family 2 member B-like [Heteronotia binoei]|uniref:C-type lectin domain family 2 member B-like n=1 Tax=Heteronotia binoei TaxID=13085 RepID=UPI0029319AA8|nr:C-type lectin domain family 2 member B-like [Heteronotia binoei]
MGNLKQRPPAVRSRSVGSRSVLWKKKFVVVSFVFVIIIVIIVMAAKETRPCSPHPFLGKTACPQYWIGYHGKCYYMSNIEKDWNSSEAECSTFDATLALIDSLEDMHFLVNLTRPVHHWIGLSKQTGLMWKWQNGTEFDDQFLVRGDNACAYLDDTGVSSTRCSLEKNFLCSQPDACAGSKRRN